MSEYWLQISAGQGPAECQWVVERLVEVLCTEASDAGLSARLVETAFGESRLPRSVLIALAGNGADTFAEAVQGTVQWIGASPFRPRHKRKNWFVGVFALPPPGESALLDERDVSFKPTKASGPGGQHVNKTESAVRAVHEPTGLTTVAQDERSQHANKRLALVKLAALLMQREAEDQASHAQERWQRHQGVERGNPVRIYEGPRFRRRKAR